MPDKIRMGGELSGNPVRCNLELSARFGRANCQGSGMRAMLQNVPILAGLDDAAVTFLWDRIVENSAPAGSEVVREGESGNRFFLIGGGSVRVCKHFGQPNEVELVRLDPGDFFGEMCIL